VGARCSPKPGPCIGRCIAATKARVHATDRGRESQQRDLTLRPITRCAALALSAVLAPGLARASTFQGETLDSVAMGLAWFIVIVMPVMGIIVFSKLHILPEKIAEKRHHPQKEAIQVLGRRYRDAGIADVTVKLYAAGRHEILNETHRDEVSSDIIAWLRVHSALTGLPGGFCRSRRPS
jgi:hypothetical protein